MTKRILIVDDYKTMIKIIRNILIQLDFSNVEESLNGEEALRKLRASPIDLIISDWDMLPMSGLELLKIVRSDPQCKHIPFMMITSNNKSSAVIEAKTAGADSYIIKPFNAATLRARLNQIFGPSA